MGFSLNLNASLKEASRLRHSRVAEAKAAETLSDVKASMRINYFDSDQSDMYQK